MTPHGPPDQVGDVLRGEQRLQELGRDVGVGWGAALTPRLRGGHRHHLQVLVLVVLAQRRLWGGDMGGGYGGDAVMMPGALGGPEGRWEDPRGLDGASASMNAGGGCALVVLTCSCLLHPTPAGVSSVS